MAKLNLEIVRDTQNLKRWFFWYAVIVAVWMFTSLVPEQLAGEYSCLLFRSSSVMGWYLVNISMLPPKIEARPHFG